MTNIREVAYDTLLDYEKNKTSYVPVKEVIDKLSFLDKTDRGFLQRLIEGVIERKETLDYVLNQYSKIPVNKQKPPIRVILRIGVYQILYMDSVPDYSAVNECVKLAKKRNLSNLSGVVNGVLRNIAKNKDNIEWPDKQTNVIEYLSVMYSSPKWITSMLVKEQGEINAESVLANSVSVRPITARVNLSKTSREDVIDRCMSDSSVQAVKQSDILENVVVFEQIDNVSDIEAVREGLVCIQDVASVLVGRLSGIKKDDTVLDLCAAPGGKSLHAADIATEGKVYSCDIGMKKVSRIQENIERCGFTNVEAIQRDATMYYEEFDKIADVIIADLPCSGLGVMGRKNDIKYNLCPEQIEELSALSKKILTNCARYLKDGGTLMFSTCTVSKKENNEVVDFVRSKLGLKSVSVYDELPEAFRCEEAKDGYVQLYGKDGLSDGFFIAKFKK